MPQQNATMYGDSASKRWMTTMLAGGWGVASAYILFNSLLVTHDARPCFIALVPLVVAWATLERKRWGRLALLGLSATALGLFVTACGYMTAKYTNEVRLDVSSCIHGALKLFGDDPAAATAVLALAATTGLWLRRPQVVAEFERGKRPTLATAQRSIAMSLVGFWGIVVLFTPLTPQRLAAAADKANTHKKPAASTRRDAQNTKSGQMRKVTRHSSRSAVSANNL